jgi:hypothetical protein
MTLKSAASHLPPLGGSPDKRADSATPGKVASRRGGVTSPAPKYPCTQCGKVGMMGRVIHGLSAQEFQNGERARWLTNGQPRSPRRSRKIRRQADENSGALDTHC